MADGRNFTIPPFPVSSTEYDPSARTTVMPNSSGISTASILLTGIMLSVQLIWCRLRSKFISVPQEKALDVPEIQQIPDNLAQVQQI